MRVETFVIPRAPEVRRIIAPGVSPGLVTRKMFRAPEGERKYFEEVVWRFYRPLRGLLSFVTKHPRAYELVSKLV